MNEDSGRNLKKEKQEERFKVAKKSFDELIKEITPFIRRRKLMPYQTAGKWDEATTFQINQCETSLTHYDTVSGKSNLLQ